MKSYFWSFHKELSRQSVATIHCLHVVISPLCCERKHFKPPQFLLLSKTNNNLQVVKDRGHGLICNLTLMWHWVMLKALSNADDSSSFPLGFFLCPPSHPPSLCVHMQVEMLVHAVNVEARGQPQEPPLRGHPAWASFESVSHGSSPVRLG